MSRKLLRSKKATKHRSAVRNWRSHYRGMVYKKLNGKYRWTMPLRR